MSYQEKEGTTIKVSDFVEADDNFDNESCNVGDQDAADS